MRVGLICAGVSTKIEIGPIRVLSITDHRLTNWCDHSIICEMGSIDY